jgi:hypothetical protein
MSDEATLNELLLQWQREMERGRDIPVAQLCRDRPELAVEVERRLGPLRRLYDLHQTDQPTVATVPPLPTDTPARELLQADAPFTTMPTDGSFVPPPAAALLGGPTVPGYQILGELGRGGMAVVYKARHLRLDRVVALKMIRAGGHAGQDELARFRTEAEAVARLRHPGVVQVYDFGDHEGLPYMALEYCEGGSLAAKLNGTPLPPMQAAALVEQVARAVDAAHRRQVVHRDLKPANVLLAEDGSPKVTDFGLAKKLDAAGQTATGVIMGTPSYMAPEQAGGNTRAVGTTTDIYALGAILYELLTGRPPFKAATVTDTLLQVLHQEPVLPRQLQQGLPRDLETICLKCLEKDPRRRYSTAEALGQDLDCFLQGRQISARPASLMDRTVKWVQRRPAVASLLATVFAVTLASIVGLTTLWLEAASSQRTALRERDEADAARAEAQRQREVADRERDRTLANLQEAVRQRERAHFYLESFLDLKRFGRSLSRHPLRKDFDLRVTLMNQDQIVSRGIIAAGGLDAEQGKRQTPGFPGELPRKLLAVGDFDKSQQIRLAISSQIDCWVTVFYSVPRSAKRPESCLLVYPNNSEKYLRVERGKPCMVPSSEYNFFSPVVTMGEAAYLYIVASEQEWVVKPDLKFNEMPSLSLRAFSPKGMKELAAAIPALVERPRSASDSPRVAEEIVIFNVRSSVMSVK